LKSTLPLPFRQIHLDFHTGPWITDVGSEFDAQEFARMMKDAHVNSVTVFAKCHHGHLYYNTKHPARHPGLKKNLDLLAGQVEALHRVGIRAPIYISVQCDEYAANQHPEWIARNPDGSNVGRKPLAGEQFSWQILDMSSPYQDYLFEQTAEVLKKFKPVDGIFFDMCWDQPSVSNWAKAGMLKQGLNPECEADRKTYSHRVALAYMQRYYKQVKAASPEAGVFFNSRPLDNLAEEVKYQGQVEIEALPSGFWGYMYFPRVVRYARNFGKQYLGMTARFHKCWADFGGLKPYPALEYETSQMIAHGGRCSVGDQLHPRGTLDRGAYELIGKVYQRVEEREAWLTSTKPVVQIGVLQVTAEDYPAAKGSEEGVTRMLWQLKHQFDIIEKSADFSRYELIIAPDTIKLTPELTQRLREYLKRGGKLLATGLSGLSADGTELLLPELGLKPQGLSEFTATYIRFGREVNEGVPDSDHVMYEKGVSATAAAGTKVLAKVVTPYFERSWKHFSSHAQTPSDKAQNLAAATLKGSVAYISYPIFSAFALHGNQPYRLLVRNILDLLLPEPLLRVDAPTSTETSVMQQGARTIVHLLQYCPERRGEGLDLVEDIVPLYDVPMSLRIKKAPKRVYMAPGGQEVEFSYESGRVELVIPEVAGHAMVVVE
jgi:hypothetical protein